VSVETTRIVDSLPACILLMPAHSQESGGMIDRRPPIRLDTFVITVGDESVPGTNEEFEVWAKIAGPRLPTEMVRIGSVRIGPAAGNTPVPIDAPRIDLHDGPGYVASPAMVEVESDCWLIATVRAADHDAALALAIDHVIPTAVGALSLGVSDGPYRTQVLGVQSRTDPYSYSPPKAVYVFQPADFDNEQAEAATRRLEIAPSNDHLTHGMQAFTRGIALLDQHGGAVRIFSGA
jgi:hypothetical protein